MKNGDRLDIVRDNTLAKISELESEIKRLRDKLDVLDEIEREAKSVQVVAKLNSALVASISNGATSEHTKTAVDTSGGLTETILHALRTRFKSEGVTPPEMRRFLLSIGYAPKGKNFHISVGTTLKRLTESSRAAVHEDTVTGKKRFYPVI